MLYKKRAERFYLLRESCHKITERVSARYQEGIILNYTLAEAIAAGLLIADACIAIKRRINPRS